jgi:hypothetical protein
MDFYVLWIILHNFLGVTKDDFMHECETRNRKADILSLGFYRDFWLLCNKEKSKKASKAIAVIGLGGL